MTEQQDSPAPEVPSEHDPFTMALRRSRESAERMRQRLSEPLLNPQAPSGIPCE